MAAKQENYNKSERNAALRQVLKTRSKVSVELKQQNISAMLHGSTVSRRTPNSICGRD
jgi:hypothetical protein